MSGQSKPWGYRVRYSAYIEGDPPSEVAVHLAATDIEEELGPHDGRLPPVFIGVWVEEVQDEPKDQVAT